MTEIVDLADALVTWIEQGVYSDPYAELSPERIYDPDFTPDQLRRLNVSVIPDGWSDEVVDREDAEGEYRLWVVIQKQTGRGTVDLDKLVRLVEEVSKRCLRSSLTITVAGNPQTAQATAVECPDLYDITKLREHGVFFAFLTVRYRLVREVP